MRYVSHLSNNYSGMRHGQSKANVENVIVSCIGNDHRGNMASRTSAASRHYWRRPEVPCQAIRSSAVQASRAPCRRHRCQHGIGSGGRHGLEALRERCFGDWEGMACDNYVTVWAADKASPDHSERHVESVSAVLARATAFIIALEQRYSGRDILLVSHGDTLQILQAGFLRMNPGQHRDLPPFEPAEIRRFHLG